VQGFQGALGVAWTDETVTGVQLSGGLAMALRIEGVQIGGVSIAHELRGVQLGLVSFGHDVEGPQLGC